VNDTAISAVDPRSLLINSDISHTRAVTIETGNTGLTLGFIQIQ
jgi:hypothetical protein